MRADTHPISVIAVPDGRRTLNDDVVQRLMNSIERIGLKTPPTVRIVDGEPPVLVSGHHRLEACRRLGWPDIPVLVMDGDDVQARLWEISENLHRSELSPVERAEQIDEWRKLTADGLRQVAANPQGGRPATTGSRTTARDLGVSETTVRRSATIASLPEETRQKARDEGWTQKQLLQAAKPVGEVKPAPKPRNDIATVEWQVHRIMSCWNEAGPEAQEAFLQRIGRG